MIAARRRPDRPTTIDPLTLSHTLALEVLGRGISTGHDPCTKHLYGLEACRHELPGGRETASTEPEPDPAPGYRRRPGERPPGAAEGRSAAAPDRRHEPPGGRETASRQSPSQTRHQAIAGGRESGRQARPKGDRRRHRTECIRMCYTIDREKE